ncbi:MAG: T9SS type A sorting domain-containing protein [bacterium]
MPCNIAFRLIITFFITGITTTHAQIVDLSGDLLDQIESIRSHMPGRDSEGFVKPSKAELTGWRELITALLEGRLENANTLVQSEFSFYQLYRFTDTGFNQQLFYLLREKFPVTKGWGTFMVNPNFERPICIEIPHAIYDINTYKQGTDIFRRTGARFLIMAGTHRCGNSEPSPCDGSFQGCGTGQYHITDMAHFVDAPFQATHETIVTHFPQTYAFSIHGNSNDNCEDIFLSNGRSEESKPILFNLKSTLLAAGGVSVAVAGDGTSSCPFIGSTNTQGRFTNGSPDPCTQAASSTNGYFIHVEQRRWVRDNFSVYVKLIDAINTNIAHVTSVEGKDQTYGENSPKTIALHSIYPNPFRTSITISYELPERRRVTLKIYNLKGQLVRVLEQNVIKNKGFYQLQWDGTNKHGKSMPSGTYFIKLAAGNTLSKGKITLLR